MKPQGNSVVATPRFIGMETMVGWEPALKVHAAPLLIQGIVPTRFFTGRDFIMFSFKHWKGAKGAPPEKLKIKSNLIA